MKTIRFFGLFFAAVFTVGVYFSTAAFAADEMLVGGKPVPAEGVTGKGSAEFLIEDTGSGAAALYSWFEDLKINPNNVLVIETLMLDDTLLNENGVLNGPGNDAVEATAQKVCSGEPRITFLNMPYKYELELMSGTEEFLLLYSVEKTFSFDIDCTVLGILTEDKCEGLTTALLENMTEGLLVIFNSQSELLNCSVGGEKTGVIEGSELVTSSSGTVAVS